MKILIIKTGALGDVVRTTAILPALLTRHPGARITWLTAPLMRDLLECHPSIDRLCLAPRDIEALAEEAFDWVISLEEEYELCALASRIGAARLSGACLDAGGQRTYTPETEPWFGMSLLRPASRGGLEAANRLKRANEQTHARLMLDCLGLGGEPDRPSLAIGDARVDRADRLVRRVLPPGGRPVYGLSTGAGGRWTHKALTEDATAALARLIAGRLGGDVLLLGGAAEADRNARIKAAAAHPAVRAAPTDLALGDFAALVGRCDFVVCSDSLTLHLANAQAVPFLAWFGPTSAAEIDLYDTGQALVADLPCRCCYLADCDVRPSCSQRIGAGALFRAIQAHPARQLSMAKSASE
jgi:heptosyltransferase-2